VLGTQRNPEEILSSINSGVLPVVAACVACLLSIVEHRRTVHPSTLLTLYLLAYVAGEAAKVTAPANYPKDVWSLNVSIGRLCIGLAFFIVENIDKRSILRESYQQVSTEETVGILGRTFFWWINPILREGNRSILVAEDLPCVDEKLSSGDLRKGIIQAWNNRSLTSLLLSEQCS
jgi:ATP-binding cassette subfamily C (CFTR/MRP) protein 1